MPPSQSERHSIVIGASFLDGKYVAACTCGWKGEKQDTMREASADSASHLDFEAHADGHEIADCPVCQKRICKRAGG